jgi:hypothetical protein
LSSSLLSINAKIIIFKAIILPNFLWAWTFIFHIKGRIWTGGVREQGAEENMCAKEELNNRRLEKIA